MIDFDLILSFTGLRCCSGSLVGYSRRKCEQCRCCQKFCRLVQRTPRKPKSAVWLERGNSSYHRSRKCRVGHCEDTADTGRQFEGAPFDSIRYQVNGMNNPMYCLFQKTDIAEHALEALSRSRIKNVKIIGRRGPLQVGFSMFFTFLFVLYRNIALGSIYYQRITGNDPPSWM